MWNKCVFWYVKILITYDGRSLGSCIDKEHSYNKLGNSVNRLKYLVLLVDVRKHVHSIVSCTL